MKKMLICLFIAGAMIFVGSNAAMAYRAGEMELTLGGIGSSDESLDGTDLNVGGSLGYFLTDALSVALRQDVYYTDLPKSDAFSGVSRLAMDYHFEVNEFLYPFIGANIGYMYGDIFRDQWIAGPEIGLKYFANETTFIYGLIEYSFTFKSSDDIEDNFDDGRFGYSLGIGFKF